MPATAFLNGQFHTLEGEGAATPMLSALDAGLQHGVGLFETMLGGVGDAGNVWCLRIDEHMARLAESARELGLSDQLRTGALAEAVAETIRRSGLHRARVRLTLTGGDLNMLRRGGESGPAAPTPPTVLIIAQRATEYPAPMYERGVLATLADSRANPLNLFESHKTLNYWWRLRELQLAAAKGAAEAIVLSATNHLAGGCVSNLLLVKDGELLTPFARGEEGHTRDELDAEPVPDDPDSPPMPAAQRAGSRGRGVALPSPVLPGIVRRWAIDWARRQGMVVSRRMLSIQDLLDAEEALLTNSSWGVLPVVRIEANAVGAGTPGPTAARLVEAWRALVQEYASGAAG